jgi:membrane glycosyltransferase
LFLLVGILISLQAQFIRPEYFPAGATLFPLWPAQDPVRAAYVFVGTMALLVLPKLLGYLAMVVRRHDRRGIGGVLRGFVSMVLEIVISALIAPVMMLMQVRSVAEILLGRDAGWSAQRRDDGSLTRADFIRQYTFPTVLGLLLAAGAYAVSTPLLLWMSPVVIGLVLAIPVASFTARSRVGRRLRDAGLLLTPEEHAVPAVLTRANAIAAGPALSEDDPIALLARDHALYEAHVRMLGDAQPRAKGEVDVHRVVALAKIDDADTCEEALAMLGRREIFAVLASREALQRLLAKPRGERSSPPALRQA